MKTKSCKPIVIPIDTKDALQSDRKYLTITNGKLFNPFQNVYYQLFLISLEEEKIKKFETYYSILHNQLFKCIHNQQIFADYERKIIATQDMIPPKYIIQFIEEYNKNEVNAVNIEMTFDVYDDDVFAKHDWKPKLTNGFVNIINNQTNTNIQSFELDYKTSDKEYKYLKALLDKQKHIDELIDKFKNCYTEEEVYQLCLRKDKEHWAEHHNDEFNEINSINWFQNNKK